jgi:hypothetical protein
MVDQPSTPLAPANVASEAGTTVRVCRTIAKIEEIRPYWASWKGHRDSDIDFYLEFIQSRPEVLRPHVVVLSRGAEPDAILVGRLERTKFQSRIAYFRLPGVPVHVLSFSYGGFRGNTTPENSSRAVRSVLQSLRGGEADLAFFHQAQVESPMYRDILKLPDFRGRDHLIAPAAHHFMRIADAPEQLLSGLSSKHRKHLRNEAKKIQTDFEGRVEIRQFNEAAQLDEALEHVEAIAKTTYQRGLGVGFANSAEERRVLRFFGRMGWLRIYVLFFKDVPCAYSVGSVSDGVYCCDYLGFNPQWGGYSPGTFLLTHMLEDFCRAGITEVDFGPGEGMYKERFSNLEFQEASVYVFAPSAKGMLLNSVRTATVLADSSMKKALKRTNLLPKIKRMWRDRAAGKKAAS